MKRYPFLLLLGATVLFSSSAYSQGLLNRAKEKLKGKADQKVDKTIDEALEGKKKTEPTTTTNNKPATTTTDDATTESADAAMAYTSKYDFVPGERIIAFEDFNNTEVGDFPTRWNTNASAEVVTLNNKPGKWLKITKEGTFHPEFITTLPDNFTLEYDLAVNPDWNSREFVMNIANLSSPEDYTNYYYYVNWKNAHAVHMQFRPKTVGDAWSKVVAGNSGNHSINNDVQYKTWDNAAKNFAHISIWRQNQRLRVYVNGEKIWDLPRAFEANGKYNAITFANLGTHHEKDYYLITNIRLAVGAPDTRNKLMTEGKFVSRGILFDFASDKIKPESAGALKDIAKAIQENPGVKVRIVGHTDIDGDDKANLELSKRRALAVKAYLVKNFQIPEADLETDGKGEAEPVDVSTSTEGRANNRRVEFIKI
jgi:outer membrane protein OmpA-like peptidoglycan-associated protein